jgi:hypothetical protein
MPVMDIQGHPVDHAVGQVPGVLKHPGVILIDDISQGRGSLSGAG